MDIILCSTWRNLNNNFVDYGDLIGRYHYVEYLDENGSVKSFQDIPNSVYIEKEKSKYFSGVPVLETNGDPLTIRFKVKFTSNVETPHFAYNYVFDINTYGGYFITSVTQKAPQVVEITARRDVLLGPIHGSIRIKTETLPDLKPTDPVEKIVDYPINNIPTTDTSAKPLSKNIVDDTVSAGRLYMVLSQNKTDVPNLQKLASQGDIADLLKSMSFSSLESFTDNFDGTTYDNRLLAVRPGQLGGAGAMAATVPGGYYFMTGDYSIGKLFKLLRDDPHYANIVQDMWWSPLTFGNFPKTTALEGIGKEAGITMYGGGQSESLFSDFHIDLNLKKWFSKYSIQWAGQEITWSPSDYGYSGTQHYYWQVTRAISSSDSDKLKLFLSQNATEDIQIGVISNPVVKINPITRSFTTSLQSSFYSILTGNTLGLLGYTASNIGKDNDNDDDDDGGDKEKVNPIMKMLADIFSGIAGTLLFSGSVAPLKDAQNAVATGGGAGSNSNTNGNMVPTLVKSYPGDLGFKIANSVLHTPSGSPVKAVGKSVGFYELDKNKFYSGEYIGTYYTDAGVNAELDRILNKGIYVYE